MRLRFLLLFLVLPVSLVAQTGVPGHWEGVIALPGNELAIRVDIAASGDSIRGTIDVPQQGATGLRLTVVTYAAPRVYFEFPAGFGVASFSGELRGDSITGAFRQSGVEAPFRLARGVAPRPVSQKDPPPYKEEEVVFRNGEITLAGTLSVPPDAGPYPAVILISGSGAQNRDEEIFGFKVFQVIADHLVRRGIAVLRYDDRGVGGSTGSMKESTIDDFAADADAALKFLRSRADIDRARIGLCGHSEGGVVGSLLASRSDDVAFLVLVASIGVRGEEVLLDQIRSLSRAGGASQEDIDRALDLERRTFAVVRSDTGWDGLTAALRQELRRSLEGLTPEQRSSIPDPDALIEASLGQQLSAARTPWFRDFIDRDPSDALLKVRCPVLALFGELDMQVSVSLNKGPLEDALRSGGNPDHSVRVLPGANHLFQAARTGGPEEYASLKKEFVPEFLETLGGWITERTMRK